MMRYRWPLWVFREILMDTLGEKLYLPRRCLQPFPLFIEGSESRLRPVVLRKWYYEISVLFEVLVAYVTRKRALGEDLPNPILLGISFGVLLFETEFVRQQGKDFIIAFGFVEGFNAFLLVYDDPVIRASPFTDSCPFAYIIAFKVGAGG